MFVGWLIFFAMGVAVVLLINGLIFGGRALAKWLQKKQKSVAAGAAGTAIVLAMVAGAEGPSPALEKAAEEQASQLRAHGLEVRTVVVDAEEARRLEASADPDTGELPPGELLVVMQEPVAEPAPIVVAAEPVPAPIVVAAAESPAPPAPLVAEEPAPAANGIGLVGAVGE